MSDQYDPIILAAANSANVDPARLKAIISQESSFNPSAYNNETGAAGIAQFIPATAKAMGIDPTDPVQSINGAAKLLSASTKLMGGDESKGAAAYFGGPNQQRWGPKTEAYQAAIDAKTKAYQGTINQPFIPSSMMNDFAPASSPQSSTQGTPQASAPGQYIPATMMNDFSPSNSGTQPASAPTTTQNTYNPTDGMSNFDKFAAGAGKAVVDIGHGLKQIGAEAANAISPSLVSDQTVTDMRKEEDARKNLDAPLMATKAGLAGDIAGNVAATVVPGSLLAKGATAMNMGRVAMAGDALANPTTWKGAAGAGALLGATQPVGTDDSRTGNSLAGAAGGTLGQGIVKGIGTVVQPIKNQLGDIGNDLVNVLKDHGVNLDLSQTTGSPLIGRLKSALSDNVFTMGKQADFAARQQSQFNHALLGTFGENASAATPDVMAAAKKRIGSIFDEVASRNTIPYEAIQDGLATIQVGARKVLNDSQFGQINRNIDDIMSKAANNGGYINGPQYQNIKQTLDKISKGGDQQVGEFARDMRTVLSNGLEQSAAASGNNSDVALLQTANRQYRNMKLVENAIAKDGSGDISPAMLANSLYTKANRFQSVYGGGDQQIMSLATAGKNILRDKTPNSGTTARILANLIPGAALAGGAQLVTGDPWEAAKFGLGAIALPKLLQYGMNNPRVISALSDGIKNVPLRNLLSAPRTIPAVGQAIRIAPATVYPYLGAKQAN